MPQDTWYDLKVGELSQHVAEKLAELMDEAELTAEAPEAEGDSKVALDADPGTPAPQK